jgi:hypothetical protein
MAVQRPIPLLEKTTTWLLESQTPSIRYLTLKRIMGLAEDNPKVAAARDQIASSPPVSRILAAQDPDGFWANANHIYSPKYRSSHWTMLQLIELGLNPENASLQKGADFMLTKILGDQPYYLRLQERGFGCFWGDWLRYELYCGKGEDPFTNRVVDFICNDMINGSKCRYNSELPCAWAVVRELYGLALIPEDLRNEKVQAAIQSGIRFLLEDYNLLEANYPADQKRHPLWDKLSFPIFYHADRLFVLRVLKDLNALDHPGTQTTLDWLLEKQTQSGIWRGGSPLSDRTRPFLAKPDGVERWITLQALDVLI